ncbi:hypothetical protein GmRootA79_03250 [Acidovorax sp. A79]|uniref:hypothetical protein n=1 Tax=Acidovorax sp. A79 TaxID=3056107 RepID=UPI0012074CCD|nr:MAG: hypothetical protein EON49_00740 [Acidovorax sp.]
MAALNFSAPRIVAPTPTNKLLPFEKALLDATAATLPAADARLLAQQVLCINNIRRVSDWKQIELYSKRWLWHRWPAGVLFARKEKFRLATVSCRFGVKDAHVEVWAVDGHVSALSASTGLSGLSIAGPLSILAVDPGS